MNPHDTAASALVQIYSAAGEFKGQITLNEELRNAQCPDIKPRSPLPRSVAPMSQFPLHQFRNVEWTRSKKMIPRSVNMACNFTIAFPVKTTQHYMIKFDNAHEIFSLEQVKPVNQVPVQRLIPENHEIPDVIRHRFPLNAQ